MSLISFVLKMMSKAGIKVKKEFDLMSEDPMKYQEDLFWKIINAGKNTEYGKKIGLDKVTSIEDFQKMIPLSSYDDYAPYIDRMAEDGSLNLLTEFEFKHFNKTSGTMGCPKKIPTSEYSINCFSKYYAKYLNGIASNELGFDWCKGVGISLNEGKLETLKSGRTYGSASSLSTQRMSKSKFMSDQLDKMYSSPREVKQPAQGTNTRYLHTLYALKERNISYGNCTFSSFFLELLRYIENHWEMLCNDIETGILSSEVNIPDETRIPLQNKLKPDPKRAQELREIFQKGFDEPFIPKVWPKFQWLLFVGGAGFTTYTQKIREKYAGDKFKFLFLGLSASEGLFSVPTEMENFNSAFVPDCVFLEFLPFDEEDTSKTVTLKDLQVGGRYEVIITNTGGLYRYRIRDGIEVTGKYKNNFTMQFLYRVDLTVSITGEKTSEVALRETVERTAKELDFDLIDYSLFPDTEHTPARYVFLLEIGKHPIGLTPRVIQAAIEKNLAEANPSMGEKVKLGTCAATDIHILQEETYLLYRDFQIVKGASAAQLKPVHVIRNIAQEKFFFKLIEEDWK